MSPSPQVRTLALANWLGKQSGISCTVLVVVEVQQPCLIDRIFRRHASCARIDNATLGKNRRRTALPTIIIMFCSFDVKIGRRLTIKLVSFGCTQVNQMLPIHLQEGS